MKVLIIHHKIRSYRVKIFELLNDEFDLTVSFSDPKFINQKFKFKTIYLPVRKIGPFKIHKNNLYQIASQYDVVIGVSNIRWLKVVLLSLRMRRKYKIGYWGIGVTASYENKFDSKQTWNKLRLYIAKKSDFTIFYSSYPLEKYLEAGIPKSKLFVANNTTKVHTMTEGTNKKKKNFLFIGTLYKQKGIDELLESFYKLSIKREDCPKLLIIGDGAERENIEKFIKEKNLIDKVILYGAIYDQKRIAQIFNQSMVCISPKQAGLSVLTSMGNKTAFITKENAITGGEIFNIQNKVNGIIYKEDEKLVDVLEWVLDNPKRIMEMNEKAYDFYINHRTPEMMANEIKKAVYYSLKNV